jgi:hypothetical protein
MRSSNLALGVLEYRSRLESARTHIGLLPFVLQVKHNLLLVFS